MHWGAFTVTKNKFTSIKMVDEHMGWCCLQEMADSVKYKYNQNNMCWDGEVHGQNRVETTSLAYFWVILK